MTIRHICLFAVALLGCDQPSPLGTFTHDDVAKWASACQTPIVEESPTADSVLVVMRAGAFARATKRYRCAPPGWAVYTDKRDRVVGFCVDDDTQAYVRDGRPAEVEADRARELIAAHWNMQLAMDLTKDATDGHCTHGSTENVAHDLLRWGENQFSYPDPSTIYSHHMCCWEVKNR